MQQKLHSKRQYDHLQSYCIKFQSNDSEVSDGSYQSSISSNEENNVDNIEYFRQEMARFFINYPQLMNNQLVCQKTQKDQNQDRWEGLANHILSQAQQTQISLQTIAKRIAYYRKKAEQIDIIDLIAKEKDAILKQLDEEASADLSQNVISHKKNQNDKRSSSMGVQPTDNSYLSWKKRNQRYYIDKTKRSMHHNKSTQQSPITYKNQSKINLVNQHKNKRNSEHLKLLDKNTIKNTERANTKSPNKQNNGQNANQLKNNNIKSPLFNFETKTEAGRQLMQQIKRHHTHNDEIGIKKCIVNFIYKYRENLQKQMRQKYTLPQRLSKLHIQDSKQLLLFCPIKKHGIQTEMPLNNQTQQFLDILKQISQGHLMQYWRLLQQKKL